jgi:hypothetical protein
MSPVLSSSQILVTPAIVTVNKMDKIEDIEEFYKKECAKADKEYLENLSKSHLSQERSTLEEAYKRRSKKIRDQYERRYAEYLRIQKDLLNKKNSKRPTIEEKYAHLEVKRLDLTPNWKERLDYRIDISKFVYRIKIKNFLQNMTPDFLKILFLKLKYYVHDLLSIISNIAKDLTEKTKKHLLNLSLGLKNIFLSVLSNVSNLFSFVLINLKKLLPKKKIGESKEKRPDEEIAERLLKRSK